MVARFLCSFCVARSLPALALRLRASEISG
jgi:hypothetical protein